MKNFISNLQRSLRFRVILLFSMFFIPLMLFLYYNNFYAMNVVRDQVTQYSDSYLQSNVSQMDVALDEVRLYLSKTINNDIDLNMLALSNDDNTELALLKQRIFLKLKTDLSFYHLIDSFFVYSSVGNDHSLLLVTNGNYQSILDLVESQIARQQNVPEGSLNQKWNLIQDKTQNQNYLIKQVSNGSNLFMGVTIRVNSLMKPFDFATGEGGSGSAIFSKEGILLSQTNLSEKEISGIKNSLERISLPSEHLSIHAANEKYIALRAHLQMADLLYFLVLPEKQLLQNLPFFQQAIYFTPIGGILLLLIAFYFLQKILFAPVAELVREMKKIIRGNLEVRVKEHQTNEFNFLIHTFNDMVSEIKHLKIDVYEEKIKVQKGELKHLQMQINPHFYLNSLSIISNLASLQNYKAVHKMALHLADHFRYIIRTNRSQISIDEEIRFIENYIEIHKLRFPEQLQCDIEVAENCRHFIIPSLVIQPFVENSIKHGFRQGNELLHIIITVTMHEEGKARYLKVKVSDNGIGFSLAQLTYLQTGEYLHKSSDEHWGIWNIQRRLAMYFGEDSQITFNNGENGGAIIVLRLSSIEEQTKE